MELEEYFLAQILDTTNNIIDNTDYLQQITKKIKQEAELDNAYESDSSEHSSDTTEEANEKEEIEEKKKMIATEFVKKKQK